jgi:hypothetical protein
VRRPSEAGRARLAGNPGPGGGTDAHGHRDGFGALPEAAALSSAGTADIRRRNLEMSYINFISCVNSFCFSWNRPPCGGNS